MKADHSGVDNLTWAIAKLGPWIEDNLGSFYASTTDGL